MSLWITRIKALSWGFCAAVVLMLVLSLLLSAIVFLTPLHETSYQVIAPVLNIAALAAGAYITGKRAGAKGAVLGLILSIVILLLMFVAGAETDPRPILKTSYCLAAGALGGILGVD